jgi:hypothetical protein
MILTNLIANNSKQLLRADRLAINRFCKARNLIQANCRGFQSTSAKRVIASTAALASANWILAGSSVILPFAQAYKSSRPILRYVRSLSAILITGSLLVLATSTEKNDYTGKYRLMFKDLETEVKDKILSEYNNSSFYKFIEDDKHILKDKVDDIVTKLKKSNAEDCFYGADVPNWHLLDSYLAFSRRTSRCDILVYNTSIFSNLENLTNTDQLAYLLAQALSHKVLRHETELFSFNSVINSLTLMGALSISLLTPWGGLSLMGACFTLFLGSGSLKNAYSRELEREADNLALFFAVRAGFDPKEFENCCIDLQLTKKALPSSSEESNFIDILTNSETARKLNDNIHYYLFSDKLTNAERVGRIRQKIANNQEFLEFAKAHPNYNWESLLKCSYWNSRAQI